MAPTRSAQLARPAIALAIAVALAAAACAQTFDATTVGVEATMASPAASPAQGTPFKVSRKAVYLLLGTLPVSRPALDDVLNAQVTGSQRVADLKIRVRSRWSDILFTVLTAGIIVPRTVTYEGQVVGQ
jgi:hypothetical protein